MKFIISILLIVSQTGADGIRQQASGDGFQVSGINDFFNSRPTTDNGHTCDSSTLDHLWKLQGNQIHRGQPAVDGRLRPSVALHDYHISNFEIEYNAETQALEIIAKIFIDDMEDGIAASGVTEKLYLCTDREIESGDAHIYQYLTDKFKISVNDTDVAFNFIGKEVGEELVSMYCYLEVENIDNVDEIEISNDMLMEVFDDQINIIKLVSKSTKKRGFMMLKKGAHSDTANL